jgi:Bacterial low temperature requirement A protein (LtrA)
LGWGRRVSEREQERGDEHLVTPLELFFDLVFVFAITQVTSAEHFAEPHGLIILIALGESIITIGLGAGLQLDTAVIMAAALGIVVVSALWSRGGRVRGSRSTTPPPNSRLDLEGGRVPRTQAAPTPNPPNTSNESSTSSTVLYWVE